MQVYHRSLPWILQVWKGIYWSTFVLTWIVLPITFSYLESGFFSPRDKLWDAFKDQLRTAFLAVVAVAGFCVYLLAQHYTLAGAEGLLMALGNTYGLLLVVVLLGNGLIEVPRKLWAASFPHQELQRLYFRSSLVDSDLHDAVCTLSDVEAEVTAIREHLRQNPPPNEEAAMELDACMKVLQDTRASFRHRPDDMTLGMLLPRTPFGVNSSYDQASSPPTLLRLAQLHARLKKAQLRVQVLKMQRDAVVAHVEVTEHVVNHTLRYPDGVKNGDGGGACAACAAVWEHMAAIVQWYWLTALSNCVLRMLAVACWFMTLTFLWSQMVLGSPYSLSPYGALQQAFGTSTTFGIQLAIAIPLAYVSICTYRSLFKFKLFGEFSLQGPHQSLSRPLLVNAQYLIRLQFPLAYNFLLLLRSPSSKETAFRKLMSNMAVVPLLGAGFNTYAPLVMVVLAAFTYFRGYARLLRLVGAYHEDLISGEEQEEMIQQGRSLARRRRYPLPSSSSNGGGSGIGGGPGASATLSFSSSAPGPMRVQAELGPARGAHTAYTPLKT